MKDFVEQEQQITRELTKYQLAPPSPDLKDRVLRAAGEALAVSNAKPYWADRWLRAVRPIHQELLACASAILLILGVVMQLGGSQSVLADSMERLTVMAAISGSLHRATSMDCTLTNPGAAEEGVQYRLRWSATGVTRVDMTTSRDAGRTLWVSNGTVTAVEGEVGAARTTSITNIPSQWHAPIGFLTPAAIAQQMKAFGLKQAIGQRSTRPDELMFVGQTNQQIVELYVDARTGLPAILKKYQPASAGTSRAQECVEEARFQWNEAIPQELFVPRSTARKQQVH